MYELASLAGSTCFGLLLRPDQVSPTSIDDRKASAPQSEVLLVCYDMPSFRRELRRAARSAEAFVRHEGP